MLPAKHFSILTHTARHCNTLQHTATHCNTLQHTGACQHDTAVLPATHCNILTQTAARCNTQQCCQQHTARYRHTLSRTATNYNTLQHTGACQDNTAVLPAASAHCQRRPRSVVARTGMLQHVAACCSVLQRVSKSSSVLECTIKGSGVATISRLLKIIGLFCRMSSLL